VCCSAWRSVAAAANCLSPDGVVAKQRSGRYLTGERGWVKTKNRDYWRWELEREGAFNSRRRRLFV
jgi:ATP-dependent DNA ligase